VEPGGQHLYPVAGRSHILHRFANLDQRIVLLKFPDVEYHFPTSLVYLKCLRYNILLPI